MGIFGWSLPPGCSMRDIDRAFGEEEICEICGEPGDNCECPECPVCGCAGDSRCVEKHFTGKVQKDLRKRQKATAKRMKENDRAEAKMDREMEKIFKASKKPIRGLI